MREVAFVNELFLPFGFEGYRWSAYCVCNVAFAVLCSVSLAVAAGCNASRLARPAFMVATLTHLIFQWPLALFSPIFEKSLTDFWFFAASIHLPVLSGILWVVITPRQTQRLRISDETTPLLSRNISVVSQLIVLLFFAGLTTAYLGQIGWRCTALYALMVDPELTLLAREVCGKLGGARIQAYAFGVLVNVVCPLTTYFSLCGFLSSLAKQRYVWATAWTAIGAIATLTVLLTGAKGNLLPTLIVIFIALLVTQGTWKRRIAVIICVTGFGIFLLSTFEMIRENRAIFNGRYDVGTCMARLNACDEGHRLLSSLRSRNLTLGVASSRIIALERDLCRACLPQENQRTEFQTLCAAEEASALPREKQETIPKASSTDTTASDSAIGGSIADRARKVMLGIIIRIGASPVQIAGWHYKYVEEFGSPGVSALPVAKFLGFQRTVMPSRVHDAYYHLYASGDKTSTGTAPTSFLLAYPAYLGPAGGLLAMLALLFFDFLACAVLGRLPASLKPAGIGLIAVGCMNLILSDFGATFISHGTAAALLLLFGLSFVEKGNVKKILLMGFR